MKPFATLGSEIGKVRERVRRSAESLRPSRVAVDVKEQRDRLLAKLGEQTFRLIAERKLAVPKVLQDSVERLAALLGVQLPSWPSSDAPGAIEPAAPPAAPPAASPAPPAAPFVDDRSREAASAPLEPEVAAPAVDAAPITEPAPPVASVASVLIEPTATSAPIAVAESPAGAAKISAKSPKAKSPGEKSSPKGKKRATRRRTK
jgi:hypothetical protein